MTASRPDSSRYARQLALPGFGDAAQAKLSGARVLLVGLGGLGSPAASYLAAAGVGHLTINDFDTVQQSNLHRQTLYDESQVGERKTAAAAKRLRLISRSIQLQVVDARLDEQAMAALLSDIDLVLDCTDNFASRQGINAACVRHTKTLVSGAAAGMDGQVSVFPCDGDGPCYQCYLDGIGDNLGDCEGNGILGPVTGVIGSMMALEAIKALVRLGNPLTGRVAIYDGLNAEWRTLKLQRNPACFACGRRSPQ